MKTRLLSILALCALAVTALPHPARAVTSTFDTTSEGWTLSDLPAALPHPLVPLTSGHPVVWNSTGGNPGGYVSASDLSGSNWTVFAAPAPFLGNQSANYGQLMTFDMQVNGNDGVPYPAVILVGAGSELYYNTLPPAFTWTPFIIPLTPTGWRENNWQTGATPSVATMQAVLGSLDNLYLNLDWLSAPEVAAIDNVNFAPEPAAAATLLAALLITRRRKSFTVD